jgi:arylsulfatase A-like enzyme
VQGYLAAISIATRWWAGCWMRWTNRLTSRNDHLFLGRSRLASRRETSLAQVSLWEEATRAPLIWVAPGVTKPNSHCDRTVDFMTIYPTLTDLCGIPTPKHVEGESIRALLVDPKAAWDKPAITTYKFMNHTVRTEDWRYIRYADGGEELYDETKDPYEWINRATEADLAGKRKELGKWLPSENKPDIGNERIAGAVKKGDQKKKRKNRE